MAIFLTVFSFQLTSFSGIKSKPMNITGAVAGNPRFHYIKNVSYYTVFNTPLQITTVWLYGAAMFVLHVDTFKTWAMFTPRSHVVKKPYGVFLSRPHEKWNPALNRHWLRSQIFPPIFTLKWTNIQQARFSIQHVISLNLKISLVILLTVYQSVLVMLVWRIWYWIN